MENNNSSINTTGSLYLGDNLEVLDSIPNNSIDLIYLDPPFNSKRDYSIIFKSESGLPIDQLTAFKDTWTYTAEIKQMISEFMVNIEKGMYSHGLVQLMEVWIKALEKSDPEMLAYLVMMVQRLDKLYQKLKDTGNLFLHCDPTASHYIKVVMDGIFGRSNFRNEVVWGYKTGGVPQKGQGFARKHDIILFYAKTTKSFFQQLEQKSYVKTLPEPHTDSGKRLKVQKDNIGKFRVVKMRDWWVNSGINPNDDIVALYRNNQERMGYPTQKPLSLLERIIRASCPEGGTVLDPFCGCGTSIEASYNLNRSWIGIDVCKYAIDKIMERMEKHGLQRQKDYEVFNYPFVFDHVERLLEQKQGRYIFQDWAIEHIGGISNKTKSADRGVNGTLWFFTSMESDTIGKMIISVKTDKKLQAQYIRDLIGTMNNQEAQMGGLLSLAEPSEGMKIEAAQAGSYEVDMGFWGKHTYPRVQILTIKEMFKGKQFNTPPTRKLG